MIEMIKRRADIPDLPKAFVNYSRNFAEQYNDEILERVLSSEKYKKSTLSFLRDILNFYKINNNLDKHLSSMSKYKHPKMEEIYEAARIG